MPGALVSIIIPVFNAERFLDKALDSVLLVGDGSADGSAGIASSLTSPGDDLDLLFRVSAVGLGAAKVDRVQTRHRLHRKKVSHRAHEIRAANIRSLRTRLLERRRDGFIPGHGHHPVL